MIQCDRGLDIAIAMIDALIDRSYRTPEEEELLDVLGDMVEDYEEMYYPMLPIPIKDMIYHFIENRGATYTQVASETGILEENLLRGCNLDSEDIKILSRYFKVKREVFA